MYIGFCHYIGYTRPDGKPGQDWTGLVSRVQLFHLVGYTPVPVHPPHLLQYGAFLARSLKPSSIRTYLNIIGILHKEFWLPHPLLNNWPFKSLLIGIKRAVGTPLNKKITYNCWNVVTDSYDFTLSLDSSSFVSFYGMFRKAHLLPTSPGKFDSSKQLTKAEFRFFPWGTSLSFAGERLFSFVNGWSKSLSLVFPLANYTLPPLFFMPSVLHLLPLTVKTSVGLKPPPQNRWFLNIINYSANLGIILLS